MTADRRPTLLVTRPVDRAQATARLLRRSGFSAILAPALSVEPLDHPPPENWRDCAAVIATSPRAFLAPVPAALCERPLFAVGERTAAAARRAGFATVTVGPADGRALAAHLLAAAVAGPFLYLAGEKRNPTLERRLAQAGRRIRVWARYRTMPRPAMPGHAYSRLAGGGINGVLFYSARTAAAFRAWLDGALISTLGRIQAWGLSERTLTPVRDLPWAACLAVEHPRENALLRALAAHYLGRMPEQSRHP